MKPAVELTPGGDLRIDLDHLLGYDSAASEALYARLASAAAFEEAFVSRLVDHIATGATEDGDWWSPEMAENVRSKLLPLVGDAVAELVADLVNQRDRARTMSDRWRGACWQLARYWDSMDRERAQKLREPDYHVARSMTAEEARAFIETAGEGAGGSDG